MREVLAEAALTVLMPDDLVCPDVLRLQRAATTADFQSALLRRGRLGGLLARPRSLLG